MAPEVERWLAGAVRLVLKRVSALEEENASRQKTSPISEEVVRVPLQLDKLVLVRTMLDPNAPDFTPGAVL